MGVKMFIRARTAKLAELNAYVARSVNLLYRSRPAGFALRGLHLALGCSIREKKRYLMEKCTCFEQVRKVRACRVCKLGN